MDKELTVRENDYRDMVGIRDAISGMFDDFFSGRPLWSSRFAQPYSGSGWTPAVDVRETDEEFLIRAALPGVEKEDLNLEVKENTLVLSGQVKATKDREDGWLRRELPAGQFYRAFNLSAEVEAAKVSAGLRNGILEIKLPKAERSKPRRVQIT
jgi:HSP20 family protein